MESVEHALSRLIVRKEHTVCGRCGEIMPIHPGHGTPATSFIKALEMMAYRHRDCQPSAVARKMVES